MDPSTVHQTSKRRRTEDPGSPQIQKSGDLWLLDGNIILVASDGIACRVHKSFLALHSEVFRDLFSAEGTSADETFEDCDVVRIPDSSEDVCHLLKALHFRQYITPMTSGVKYPLPMLCSLMRTSTKYLVEGVKNDVKSHLTTLFPSTLEACRSSPRYTASNNDFKFHGILGVVVGEECLPIILPAAYYQCSLRPIEEILDGIDVGGQRITLSPTAQHTALIFRDRVLSFIGIVGRFGNFLVISQDGWDDPDECHGNGIKYSLDLEFWIRAPPCDVLKKLCGRDGEIPTMHAICDKCQETLADFEKRFQHDLWDALPRLCGRESWDKLRDSDA